MRIVAETGRTLAEVARDRGINETALATWVSRAPASRRHRVRR
nr:transposase [Streptomyces sp. NBC_00974]